MSEKKYLESLEINKNKLDIYGNKRSGYENRKFEEIHLY